MCGAVQITTYATRKICFMAEHEFVFLSLDTFLKLTMRQKREYLDAFKKHLEATADALAVLPHATPERRDPPPL